MAIDLMRAATARCDQAGARLLARAANIGGDPISLTQPAHDRWLGGTGFRRGVVTGDIAARRACGRG